MLPSLLSDCGMVFISDIFGGKSPTKQTSLSKTGGRYSR